MIAKKNRKKLNVIRIAAVIQTKWKKGKEEKQGEPSPRCSDRHMSL